jgi:hypothetical protein
LCKCVKHPFEGLLGDESKRDEEESSFWREDSVFNFFGWDEISTSRTESVILEEKEGSSTLDT